MGLTKNHMLYRVYLWMYRRSASEIWHSDCLYVVLISCICDFVKFAFPNLTIPCEQNFILAHTDFYVLYTQKCRIPSSIFFLNRIEKFIVLVERYSNFTPVPERFERTIYNDYFTNNTVGINFCL